MCVHHSEIRVKVKGYRTNLFTKSFDKKLATMRFLYVLTIATAQAAAFSNRYGSSVSVVSPLYPLSIAAVGGRRSKYHTKSSLKLNLSPSSMSSLLVRGGSAAPVLKNFYGDALGYFGGIRIPATFLAGSSLAAIL